MARPALRIDVTSKDRKTLQELLSGGVQQVRVGEDALRKVFGPTRSTPDSISWFLSSISPAPSDFSSWVAAPKQGLGRNERRYRKFHSARGHGTSMPAVVAISLQNANFPAPWRRLTSHQTPINSGVGQKQKSLEMFCTSYLQQIPEKGSVHVTFLLNFFDELRRRVP